MIANPSRNLARSAKARMPREKVAKIAVPDTAIAAAVPAPRVRVLAANGSCACRSDLATRGQGSGVFARVAGAVLEYVGFAVYRQDHCALVGMGLVKRSLVAPDELAGAADAVVVVE
jgi:hypothetical protein